MCIRSIFSRWFLCLILFLSAGIGFVLGMAEGTQGKITIFAVQYGYEWYAVALRLNGVGGVLGVEVLHCVLLMAAAVCVCAHKASVFLPILFCLCSGYFKAVIACYLAAQGMFVCWIVAISVVILCWLMQICLCVGACVNAWGYPLRELRWGGVGKEFASCVGLFGLLYVLVITYEFLALLIFCSLF